MTTNDTYPQPAHGWTCFHCGETFTTPGSAQDHFGETPDKVPGCKIKVGEERGLLMELRKVEAERDSLLAVSNTVIAAAYKRDHEKAVAACGSAAEYTPEIKGGEGPANVIQMLSVLLAEARSDLEAARAGQLSGLGRVTDEGGGILTLQFADEAHAASFMDGHLPTVLATDLPPAPLSSWFPQIAQLDIEEGCDPHLYLKGSLKLKPGRYVLGVLPPDARKAAEYQPLVDAAAGLLHRYGAQGNAKTTYDTALESGLPHRDALAKALDGLPVETLPSKLVVAGYQMLLRPTVVYPEDYKPSDTNNFRTLYAINNGKTTSESDELEVVCGMADTLDELACGIDASGIASRADAELLQRAAPAFRIFDMRQHLPLTCSHRAASAALAHAWVSCPICGADDMRQDLHDGEGPYIHCRNQDCASNGGANISALQWHNPELARVLDSRWDAPTVMGYLLPDALARSRTGLQNVEDTLNALLRLEKGVKLKFGVEVFAAPARPKGEKQ